MNTMDQRDYDYWFGLGRTDDQRERGARFRNRGGRIVPSGEGTEDWTDQELLDRGSAYLDGYMSE